MKGVLGPFSNVAKFFKHLRQGNNLSQLALGTGTVKNKLNSVNKFGKISFSI